MSTQSFVAGGTIRAGRFVKITDDFTASESDANELSIGISSFMSTAFDDANAALVGQGVTVRGLGDQANIVAGGVIAAGDLLKSDADGRAVPIAAAGTTVQNYGAIAMQAAAAAGEVIKVQVLIGKHRPALA